MRFIWKLSAYMVNDIHGINNPAGKKIHWNLQSLRMVMAFIG